VPSWLGSLSINGRISPGPWAALTSAPEWAFLVPAFPCRQPIFTLRQPYWVGFIVHATSASMYPLFPFLRDGLAGVGGEHNRRFGYGWAVAALAGVLVLGALALLGANGREAAWLGHDSSYDQSYIRRMEVVEEALASLCSAGAR
jgi:hypothetical protein